MGALKERGEGLQWRWTVVAEQTSRVRYERPTVFWKGIPLEMYRVALLFLSSPEQTAHGPRQETRAQAPGKPPVCPLLTVQVVGYELQATHTCTDNGRRSPPYWTTLLGRNQ